MEKSTRNTIQRATQVARELLEGEFREQLEGTFDILLDGTIAAQPGAHLTDAQKVLRRKLISALHHRGASGQKSIEAVDGYLREAAFTTLNRFVALKMLEARELVQECISKGEESSGYKEYAALAPGLVALDDHGYRAYIESIFDEIGREVRVLFDRRDPAGLMWPRRQALRELLGVLNAPELASVWIEDETIGWVYQYFNGEDERRAMRKASQAPRDSRELAVRNQFFTPRYVVQFLVDNTLGRTWYEMMQGITSLQHLDYLVRRQHEVFLTEGEAMPEEPAGANLGTSAEHPFPIRFRAKKDPRGLKILDPACGSGHFLLYTFDLLLTIYEEAWHDESAAAWEGTGHALHVDYADPVALRSAAPELILRHNLYGIDIDHRATQIAALALWLRAQRAFQEKGLPSDGRPAISRTNVVVAEPMPGEADLLEAFVATLPPKVGALVETVFKHMRIAGEAGYLLRIDELIRGEIAKAYSAHGGIFADQEKGLWADADRDVRNALERFSSESTASQAFSRQLFAEDAARGLGFIDVCSKNYDAILMNPPFGQCTPNTFDYLRNEYRGAHTDIYAGFLERAVELSPLGRVGAITSRSFIVAPRLEPLRHCTIVPQLEILADLGLGVMDDAFVEAAAFILDSGCPNVFHALDSRQGRAFELQRFSFKGSTAMPLISKSLINKLPQLKILYSMPVEVIEAFQNLPPFEPTIGTAREGMKSFDNDRFIRVFWEVPSHKIGHASKWSWFVKGGEQAFYYSTPHLLLNWNSDGAELKAVNLKLNGSTAQVRQASKYWRRPGATYSKRSSKGFSARALPENCIFSSNGPAVLSESTLDNYTLLGWLNSKLIRALIHIQSNAADYSTGSMKKLPWPREFPLAPVQEIGELRAAIDALMQQAEYDDIDPIYAGIVPKYWRNRRKLSDAVEEHLSRAIDKWDELVATAYGFRRLGWAVDLLAGNEESRADISPDEVSQGNGREEGLVQEVGAFLGAVLGGALGRFDVRSAKREHPVPSGRDPFGALPVCSPGMLTGEDGLPVDAAPRGYPIDFPRDGILVDDPGAPRDLPAACRQVFDTVFGDPAARWYEAADILDDRATGLRTWFAKQFFELHIKRYSKSGRKAPIYWQLATPSASYSVWLYYHRFTRDTLFRVLNDHVTPKLQHEERKLSGLRQEGGPNPSSAQLKAIDAQETFVGELRAMRDEIARVAPLWYPNLNDGVILNFAPLWRLVPQHKTWQKECKSAWDKLCKGDYDWAHLAMHLWPERVVPKCAKDRSLAIAHWLEDVFWQEVADGKWESRKVGSEKVEQLIADRTVPAVRSALNDLISAPALTGGRRRRTRS